MDHKLSELENKIVEFEKLKEDISKLGKKFGLGAYFDKYMNESKIRSDLLERVKKGIREEGILIQHNTNQSPTFNDSLCKNVESIDFEVELVDGEYFPVKFELIGNKCKCTSDYIVHTGKKYKARIRSSL